MSETLIRRPPPTAEPDESGPYTVEDFYRLVPDGVKADLIDGWIYVASPDTDRANLLNGFLWFLLRGYVDVTNAGEVFGSRYAFRLTPKRCPEPDVAFVAKERKHILERLGGIAAPDLAVEIVAKDSRKRDYTQKFRLYQNSGVREYWIIDPLRQHVSFYRLRDGEFVLMEPEGGIYRSEVLPGFWLRVDWLLADPLPSAYACLQQILAEGP